MCLLGIVWAIVTMNSLMAVGQRAFAQVADSSANVKAVMKAEQAWWRGEMTGDTTTMARLMASTYESSYQGQGATDRAELLGMIRPDTAGELRSSRIGRFATTARPLWQRRTIA